MLEIWRDIKDYEGFEGIYQMNQFGIVINIKTGKIVKPYKVRNDYLEVKLCNNNKVKNVYVHRLVAMTFPDLVDWTEDAKGKPFNEIEVNHKDQNKSNNRWDNLEWCDRDYNNKYSKNKPVLQYTKDGQFVKEYSSATEASIETNITHSHICRCCRGERKSAGGYIWKYKE